MKTNALNANLNMLNLSMEYALFVILDLTNFIMASNVRIVKYLTASNASLNQSVLCVNMNIFSI